MIRDFWAYLLRLGNDFENVIRPVIDFFKIDNVPPLIALAIWVAGAICLVYFLYIHFRDSRLISGASKIIDHYKDKSEFADNIKDIDRKFSKTKGRFRHAWDEFRETTLDPAGDLGAIRNTARPHDFFTSHDLGLDHPWSRVWPHIFVGAGLLLTFIGLIAALTEARDVFDDRGAQTALKNVLQVASAKFYASVAGLSTSLIITMVFRGFASGVEKGLRTLCSAIENKMDFVTTESLTDQILTQEKYQSDQLKNLKQSSEEHVANMVSELAENFSNATTEASKIFTEQLSKTTIALEMLVIEIENSGKKMREDISAAVDGLTESVGKAGETLKQSAFDSSSELQQGSNKIREDMSATADDLREGIGEAGEALKQSVLGSSSELKEGSKQMREDISAAADNLKEGIEEAGEVLEQSVLDSSSELKKGSKQIHAALKKISEAAPEYCYIHVQAIEQAINKISDAVSTAKKNTLR